MNEWIPVSDRLPGKNCQVLVTECDYRGRYFVHECVYAISGGYDPYCVPEMDFESPGFYDFLQLYEDDSGWFMLDLDKIVAWMPLPEPYFKGE